MGGGGKEQIDAVTWSLLGAGGVEVWAYFSWCLGGTVCRSVFKPLHC